MSHINDSYIMNHRRKKSRVEWVKFDLEWPGAMIVYNSDLEWNSKNELLEY